MKNPDEPVEAEKLRRVVVDVPEELAEWLFSRRFAERRPVADIVRQALGEYRERQPA